MNKWILLLMIAMSFCVQSCVKWLEVDFNNKSEKAIYVYTTLMDGSRSTLIYPDTSLNHTMPSAIQKFEPNHRDLLGFSVRIKGKKTSWNPDTISFFVIDADSIGKYGWCLERINSFVIQRYDMTLNDCYNCNPITFPPSNQMENIKMWPKYNSIH